MPVIRVDCGMCGGRYEIADEYAGGVTRCPSCGVPVDIPALSEDEDLLDELASSTPEPVGWQTNPWGHREQARRRRRSSRKRSDGSGIGVASLVLGIVSLVIMFIPYVGWLAIPACVVGLILGIVGTSTASKGNRGVAIAGLCVSAVVLVLIVLVVILAAAGLIALGLLGGG